MQVSLTLTDETNRHVVKNMFVGYFYDMAQFDPQLIINQHGLPMWLPFGLPGPRTLEECVTFNWWIRDECELYIINANEQPAGFVIICPHPKHLPEKFDAELLDFYITPKYRRQGIGRQAAVQAFNTRRGAWVLFELAANQAALDFWHKTLDEYTQGQYEDLDGGTQQRFRNDR